jgi:hypothetical protein
MWRSPADSARRVLVARPSRLPSGVSRPSTSYDDAGLIFEDSLNLSSSSGEKTMTANVSRPMMILIAGPYRSGTNDDPALIKKNVQEMESYALPIFRTGHIPILGEWLALPLVELAGSKKIGDQAFNEIFHPIATRLLQKCDAVLRVGGPSAGADEMVRVGRSLGLKIYTEPSEIPKAE